MIPHFSVYKAEEALVWFRDGRFYFLFQQSKSGCYSIIDVNMFFLFCKQSFLKAMQEVHRGCWHNGPNKARRINKAKL